jgi:hypothetical protein
MDRAEEISHKIQRTFGIVCFQIARVIFAVAILMMVVFIVSGCMIDYGFEKHHYADLLLVVAIKLIGRYWSMSSSLKCSYAGYLVSSDFMREYEKAENSVGLMNRLRITGKLRRMDDMKFSMFVFIFFAPLAVLSEAVFIFAVVGVFTNIAGEYFLACTPLPPQKGKVRQWLESFQETPTPAFNA